MTNQRDEDRDPPGDGVGPDPRPSGALGTWLRAQREARGVSLREIADSTKISLRYLEALEHDRFEVLPAPIFTRGFLREYARIVGLDGDEVVNLYIQVAPPPEFGSGEFDFAADEAARRRSSRAPSRLVPLLLALLLLVAAAAAVWFWLDRRAADAGATPEVTATPVPLAAPEPVAPAAAPEADADYLAADGAGAPEPTTPEPAPSQSPPAAPAAAPTPAVEPVLESSDANSPSPAIEPMRVMLEFNEDCWVEFAVDGRRRTSELRAAGEVITIVAQDHVLLTLGNPSGVQITVDGLAWSPPSGTGRVVRELRIDRGSVSGRS